MKKTAKRIFALLLVLSMAIVAPVKVDAKTIKDYTSVAILYPKASPNNGEKQRVQYTKKVKAKNVKSSNKSVATASVGKDSSSKEYAIYVVPKKKGTTTITYKLGKDKHELKVIVRKYVNPFKEVRVNGRNVTSQFNKSNVCYLSYKEYKNKKITLKFKKKGTWYLPHADYCTKSGKLISCIGSMDSPSKFKMTKKGSMAYFWVTDTMDKYEPAEDCMIIFK